MWTYNIAYAMKAIQHNCQTYEEGGGGVVAKEAIASSTANWLCTKPIQTDFRLQKIYMTKFSVSDFNHDFSWFHLMKFKYILFGI